jgi:hypothetical protein
MLMTLAIVVVFSTISISLNDLMIQQAMEVENIAAQTQIEYTAYSGLVHGEVKLTEDLSRSLTDPDGESFIRYQNKYCAAWTTNPNGMVVCNQLVSNTDPCCLEVEGLCQIPNENGVCTSPNYWEGVYHVTYDSTNKSIQSSATLQFTNTLVEEGFAGDDITLRANKELLLSWE